MKDGIKLDDIATILGCAKPTACMLRSGKYERGGDLVPRYLRLMAVVEAARGASRLDAAVICRECPRDDCTGCRVAEILG